MSGKPPADVRMPEAWGHAGSFVAAAGSWLSDVTRLPPAAADRVVVGG